MFMKLLIYSLFLESFNVISHLTKSTDAHPYCEEFSDVYFSGVVKLNFVCGNCQFKNNFFELTWEFVLQPSDDSKTFFEKDFDEYRFVSCK